MTRPHIIALLALTLLATGCTQSVEQSFPGYDESIVWTAARSAANSPAYDGWAIEQNEVVERDGALQIYRRLERDVRLPGSNETYRDEAEWLIAVTLVEAETPTLRVTSRNGQVPTKVQAEGARYFADVTDILSGFGPPEMPATQPETQPETMPDTEEPDASDADAVPIDIDDLDG